MMCEVFGLGGAGGCTHVLHGRSRLTIDSRIPTMSGGGGGGFLGGGGGGGGVSMVLDVRECR